MARLEKTGEECIQQFKELDDKIAERDAAISDLATSVRKQLEDFR
jgi:hypothetical protein